jgi:hypothetical protein
MKVVKYKALSNCCVSSASPGVSETLVGGCSFRSIEEESNTTDDGLVTITSVLDFEGAQELLSVKRVVDGSIHSLIFRVGVSLRLGNPRDDTAW